MSGTGAALDVVRCTVSGNSADSGGGFFAEGALNISSSLVTQNTAAQSGAGLETDGNTGIFNSTFSGNTLTDAAANTGIAIHDTDDDGAYVTVELSTFSGNSSDSASSSTLKGVAGSVNVSNSIIANTVGGGAACVGTRAGNPDPLRNKDDDETCEGGGDLSCFDLVLADNGGPTQTHALLECSNAIDHAGQCLEQQDQRGFPASPTYAIAEPTSFPKRSYLGTASSLVTPRRGQILCPERTNRLRIDGRASRHDYETKKRNPPLPWITRSISNS